MQPQQRESIRARLSASAACGHRFLSDDTASVSLADLAGGTSLGCDPAELAGKSILLAAQHQLAAALALIELDGIAGRVILCPPDIRPEQIPFVIAKGGVDTIVTDREWGEDESLAGIPQIPCRRVLTPAKVRAVEPRTTEWVLLTSGTTGFPKLIVHTWSSLVAAIQGPSGRPVWGTFYDIRRYGGLQILLRALLGDGSLVLSSAAEPVADHLARLAGHGVTHVSGTPTHWRRALMSRKAEMIAPQYIRLSGEIVDQGILNSLRAVYPNAGISHAFASTEAGVAFEVNDGLAGFPSHLLGVHGDVEMKIHDETLHIRSNRTALRYMDGENGRLADEQGFVDTGDVVDQCGDRCFFLGRRNGVINVGGLKVYPEEVEAVINRHPAVRGSMVRSRKNPIVGALVAASIVLIDSAEAAFRAGTADIGRQVQEFCRGSLPAHKVPVTIDCIPTLHVAAAGKLVRQHA